MFYPRMSAPGVMIRCVVVCEEAVSAFARSGLVVAAAHPVYRIIPLGAKPKTAFFMGALWCVDAKPEPIRDGKSLFAGVDIRPPYPHALVRIQGAPQNTYELMRAAAREKASALHERISFFFPFLWTFCLERPPARNMGQQTFLTGGLGGFACFLRFLFRSLLLKVFKYRVCQVCGLSFQPVDWMPWRRSDFCSERCAESLTASMGSRTDTVTTGLPPLGEVLSTIKGELNVRTQ